MFYAKIFIDLYQICVLFIKYVSFLLLPCFDFNKRMLTNGLRSDIMVTRKQYTVFLPHLYAAEHILSRAFMR